MKKKIQLIVLSSVLLSVFLFSSIGGIPVKGIFIDPEPPFYSVYGKVKDSYIGNGLENAIVRVYLGSTYLGQRLTSSSGEFSYGYEGIVAVTTFKLVISRSGYVTKTTYARIIGFLANAGDVSVSPIVPPNNYNIYGYVKDINSNFGIPSVSVEIYSGTTFLNTVTSNSDGHFNYQFYSYNTHTTFTVSTSRADYLDDEKTVSGTGLQFNFGELYLIPGYSELEIVSEQFSLLPETFEEYWSLNPTEYHQISYSDGIISVTEDSGAAGTSAYVSGLLDLNSWTGEGDLSISVRLRAQSDYSGSSTVTQFRMGIKNSYDETLWSYYRYWAYEKDTDWIVLTSTISESDIQTGSVYQFYFGYYDSWGTDHSQKVSVDYLSVAGDKYPEGTLEKNYAGITTVPKSSSFDYTHSHDTDKVGVTYSTYVTVDDSLGFSTDSTPVIAPAISIGLDPDRSSYYDWGQIYEWNEVDKVKIAIEIREAWAGNIITNIPEIRAVRINEEDNENSEFTDLEFTLDALNLVVDAIGLIPVVGPFISFAGKVFTFAPKLLTDIGENTLSQSSTSGRVEAELDYSGPTYLPGFTMYQGDGSTDFKMQLQITTSLTANKVYRFKITYGVTMKHIKKKLPILSDKWEVTEPSHDYYEFHEEFDYIHFSRNEASIVELKSPTNNVGGDLIWLTETDPSIDIYETVNGINWYIVKGSSIDVTASSGYEDDQYKVYLFGELLISCWEENQRRINPSSIVDLTFTQDLSNPAKSYFKFEARYHRDYQA